MIIRSIHSTLDGPGRDGAGESATNAAARSVRRLSIYEFR
jgi:hypothetical protein